MRVGWALTEEDFQRGRVLVALPPTGARIAATGSWFSVLTGLCSSGRPAAHPVHPAARSGDYAGVLLGPACVEPPGRRCPRL